MSWYEEEMTVHGRHIVMGVGTQPYIPVCVQNINHHVVYFIPASICLKKYRVNAQAHLNYRIRSKRREIFLDLLQHSHQWEQLHWYTKSNRFHPMDYSKLSLELSSLAYIDYFYS